MSLESAKNYGYIASIIFCIMPIISFISNAFVFAQLFQTISNLIANPNVATDPSMLTAFNTVGGIAGVGLIVGALSFIALILFLIAQYKLSKYYNEPAIFRNILRSILLIIGYVIVVTIVMVLVFLTTFATIDITGATATVFAPIVVAIAVFIVLTIVFIILYALI